MPEYAVDDGNLASWKIDEASYHLDIFCPFLATFRILLCLTSRLWNPFDPLVFLFKAKRFILEELLLHDCFLQQRQLSLGPVSPTEVKDMLQECCVLQPVAVIYLEESSSMCKVVHMVIPEPVIRPQKNRISSQVPWNMLN